MLGFEQARSSDNSWDCSRPLKGKHMKIPSHRIAGRRFDHIVVDDLGVQPRSKSPYVNAARVFNKFRNQGFQRPRWRTTRTLQSTDVEKQTKLKDLQTRRDALKPDAPQYDDANKSLMQAAIDYEVWKKRKWKASPPAGPEAAVLSIFGGITTTVSEVATRERELGPGHRRAAPGHAGRPRARSLVD